jgi:hypothetical protein
MLWTTVPEAAIDKHCEPLLAKKKIGPTHELLVPPPSFDLMCPQDQ